MVSALGYSLQAMAVLPQDLVGLILKDVPDAGLARLRLTCQSLRACVDTFTSWPSIYRIFKIFNSIKVEHVTAKPGLTYVIDYDTAVCSTYYDGKPVAQSPMFPELRLHHSYNVEGYYQVSPSLFVGIPNSYIQKPECACEFKICPNGTLEKRTLALFGETIKTLSSNFQGLHFVIGRIVRRQDLVQIRLRDFGEYLLTLEIDPEKVDSCYLGRRKQLVFSSGGTITVEEFDHRKTAISETQTQEVEVSRKNSFTIPADSDLLHSQGKWLLVQSAIRVPLQVHYIFYQAKTGEEYFRYSLERNLFMNEVYDGDALCAGVHLRKPPLPDNGANFFAETIFLNDNFCLFFQPPRIKVVRAALIWIEKKRIIPLSLETQQILCSFNQITDLNYLEKEDGSCELKIEGEREGKRVQICLSTSSRVTGKRAKY